MNRFQLAVGLFLCIFNMIGAASDIAGVLGSSTLSVNALSLPVSGFTLVWTLGLCIGCFFIAYSFPKAKCDEEDHDSY